MDNDEEVITFTNEMCDYGFLSNDWVCQFTINDVKYKSVEHYVQSKKYEGSPHEQKIIDTPTAVSARILATKPHIKLQKDETINEKFKKKYYIIDGFYGIRRDWDDVFLSTLKKGIKEKFRQNYDLSRRLINTGDKEIIYVSYDKFLGNGSPGSGSLESSSRGQNILGKLLVSFRSLLIEEDKENCNSNDTNDSENSNCESESDVPKDKFVIKNSPYTKELLKLGGSINKKREDEVIFPMKLKECVNNFLATKDEHYLETSVKLTYFVKELLKQLYILKHLSKSNVIDVEDVRIVIEKLNHDYLPNTGGVGEEDELKINQIISYINREKKKHYLFDEDALQILATYINNKRELYFNDEEYKLNKLYQPTYRDISNAILNIAVILLNYTNKSDELSEINEKLMKNAIKLFLNEDIYFTFNNYLENKDEGSEEEIDLDDEVEKALSGSDTGNDNGVLKLLKVCTSQVFFHIRIGNCVNEMIYKILLFNRQIIETLKVKRGFYESVLNIEMSDDVRNKFVIHRATLKKGSDHQLYVLTLYTIDDNIVNILSNALDNLFENYDVQNIIIPSNIINDVIRKKLVKITRNRPQLFYITPFDFETLELQDMLKNNDEDEDSEEFNNVKGESSKVVNKLKNIEQSLHIIEEQLVNKSEKSTTERSEGVGNSSESKDKKESKEIKENKLQTNKEHKLQMNEVSKNPPNELETKKSEPEPNKLVDQSKHEKLEINKSDLPNKSEPNKLGEKSQSNNKIVTIKHENKKLSGENDQEENNQEENNQEESEPEESGNELGEESVPEEESAPEKSGNELGEESASEESHGDDEIKMTQNGFKDCIFGIREKNNWAKKLSNEYTCVQIIDDKEYHSVNHYYYEKMHEFFAQHKIMIHGLSPKKMKTISGEKVIEKVYKYFGDNFNINEQLRALLIEWFYTSASKDGKTLHDEYMYKAMYAKFSQNEDLKNVLLETNNKQLFSFRRSRIDTLQRGHLAYEFSVATYTKGGDKLKYFKIKSPKGPFVVGKNRIGCMLMDIRKKLMK